MPDTHTQRATSRGAIQRIWTRIRFLFRPPFEDPPSNYIEPAHEALIRAWGRVREWRAEEETNTRAEESPAKVNANAKGNANEDWLRMQRAITEASRAYRQGVGSRWGGEKRLNGATKRLRREPEWLSEPERDFLRRSWLSRRVTIGVTGAVVGGLSLLLFWYVYLTNQNLRLSQARELAARAEALQSDGPDRLPQSALVAAESLRLYPTLESRRVLADDAGRMPPLIHTFVHGGPVNELAVTSDGKFLASASSDGTVRLWDTATQKEACSPLKHPFGVRLIRMTGDAKLIFTVCGRGVVTLWRRQPDGGYRETRLQGRDENELKNAFVTDAAFSPDSAYLAWGDDAGVKIRDIGANRTRPMPVRGHGNHVQFSRDGKRLLTSTWRGSVEIWTNWHTANPVREPSVGSEADSVQADARFRYVVVGGAGGERGAAQAIPLQPRPNETSLDMNSSRTFTGNVAISDNLTWGGPFAAVEANDDSTTEVSLWDISNRKRGQTLSLGKSNRLRFTSNPAVPQQTLLLAACEDNTAHIFCVDLNENISLRATQMAYIVQERPVTDIITFPGNSLVATACEDGTVRLWAVDFRLNPVTLPENAAVLSVAFRRGELLLCGEQGRFASYRLTENPKGAYAVAHSMTDELWGNHLTISPSGNRLIWPEVEGVGLQDIPVGKPPESGREITLETTPRAGEIGGSPSEAIAITANDQYVVAGMEPIDQTLKARRIAAWHLTHDGKPSEMFRLHLPNAVNGEGRNIGELTLNENGTLFAAVQNRIVQGLSKGTQVIPESRALMWNYRGGEQPVQLPDIKPSSGAAIRVIRFAPQEDLLAVGDASGALSLWRIGATPESSAAKRVWAAQFPRPVLAVAFDADGKRMACATADQRIHVFALREETYPAVRRLFRRAGERDALQWEEIISYKSRKDVSGLAFDPDGRFLASVEDGLAYLYLLRDADLLTAAEARLARNLNDGEWRAYLPGQTFRETFPALKNAPRTLGQGVHDNNQRQEGR